MQHRQAHAPREHDQEEHLTLDAKALAAIKYRAIVPAHGCGLSWLRNLRKPEDMARSHAGWQFNSVNPSQPMLDLAARRLASTGASGRVALHHGCTERTAQGRLMALRVCRLFTLCRTRRTCPWRRKFSGGQSPGEPVLVAHLRGGMAAALAAWGRGA